VKAEKIGKVVYADTGGEGRGNIGAIELKNFTVVVDSTISKKTAQAFRTSLEPQIKSPIRKLFITHYHSDHTLGIPVFKDTDIIASEPYKRLKRTAGYQPTHTFDSSMVLKDEDLSVEINHAGGHTRDSSYLYFQEEKTLFAGDLIFAKTFFYAGDRTFNPETWRDTLIHFRGMDIEMIVPGHGPICDMEEVEVYIEFFEATSSIMEKLVQKGLSEKEALRSKEFPSFYPEYRKGRREMALANWYKFYKGKEKR